jgi:hypothetical protein
MGDMDQGQTPDLAEIMQQILGILQDHEDRISKVCAAHEDLDKEIHEDFFGPIHEQYQSSMRSKGIDDLKGRYGSTLGDISDDQWKGFGIEDVFSRIYDELEKLKGEEGWGPDKEKDWVSNIHDQAMDRIKKISGSPMMKDEKPAAAVEVKEIKTAPSTKETLSAGKRSMRNGY